MDAETAVREYLEQHQRKELVRFLTCGSVDDGKSTLIGRLLFDTKTIYEDTLASIKKDSLVHGTTGTDFDPALLTDGLKAEREQGITIDVAYRYFSTAKRKFIIADTPGHEQYTRNMATGASNCDLAVILVDARHGVLTQTKRHSFIVSLLGIRHVVVAVNKMDLVGWSEDTFTRIRDEYLSFAAKLSLGDVVFVPMSALQGDNVAKKSEAAPWYDGPSLLSHLENVVITTGRNLQDLRFPVQHVLRPNLDFRGFSGTVASGVVKKGDVVVALPSTRTSTVASIETFDGPRDEAFAGQAVTLTLADEIDVSRGDVLAHLDDVPTVAREIEATLVWMAEEPLELGREVLIKHTTRWTPARVTRIRHAIDVNTLQHVSKTTLGLNDVARVTIATARPLLVDAYRKNRVTGAFIVVDRLTNGTVGAGMIADETAAEALRKDAWDVDAAAGLPATSCSAVAPAERAARFATKPATVLLTGLSGAGKTTIAYALERALFDAGLAVTVLDGLDLRRGISKGLGFSTTERAENLRRGAEVAKLLNDAGLLVIGAFVAPDEDVRKRAAAVVGADRFFVVHLECPVDACRARDAKGMYAKADAGEIDDFPGVTAPYEAPVDPLLTIDTARVSVADAVARIVAALRAKGFRL